MRQNVALCFNGLNGDNMMIFLFDRLENIIGKRENSVY